MLKDVLTREWVDNFFEKANWSVVDQTGELGNPFLAAAKIAVANVALRSDDSMRIARLLSLPVTYTSAVLQNLNRYNQWVGKTYIEMATLISQTDVDMKEPIDCLSDFMEMFWGCPESSIDLASLWRSITGSA